MTVAWDPVYKDLTGGHARKVGAPGGPAGSKVLEVQEGLLAGAPWGALKLQSCLLVVQEDVQVGAVRCMIAG